MNLKKILVVDDEKFIRTGISLILEDTFKEQVEVIQAKNGKEAIEIIESREFDIIISDINMPFINGIDLIKEIRKSNQDVEVIVISGYDEFEYARQCMKYGVKNYLLKPINDEELIDIVSVSIGKNKDVPEEEDNKLEDIYIEKAREYIETHYFKDINMAVVSNFVSLNYSYFSSLFNKHMGMNFSDYLNYIRIQKSKVLLKNIDYKIHEISEMVGYKNSKHFTKNFKKFEKRTPMEFRLLKKGIKC